MRNETRFPEEKKWIGGRYEPSAGGRRKAGIGAR
jgi:hypothetical protein